MIWWYGQKQNAGERILCVVAMLGLVLLMAPLFIAYPFVLSSLRRAKSRF